MFKGIGKILILIGSNYVFYLVGHWTRKTGEATTIYMMCSAVLQKSNDIYLGCIMQCFNCYQSFPFDMQCCVKRPYIPLVYMANMLKSQDWLWKLHPVKKIEHKSDIFCQKQTLGTNVAILATIITQSLVKSLYIWPFVLLGQKINHWT